VVNDWKRERLKYESILDEHWRNTNRRYEKCGLQIERDNLKWEIFNYKKLIK